MVEMNVQQLLRELACLHRAGEYSRACFACLLGDTDLALQLLEQGLAAGGWYSERVLREDEDLQSLQGLPAFERLVRASLDQQRNAQVRVEPILLVEKPSDERTRSRRSWRGLTPNSIPALLGSKAPASNRVKISTARCCFGFKVTVLIPQVCGHFP